MCAYVCMRVCVCKPEFNMLSSSIVCAHHMLACVCMCVCVPEVNISCPLLLYTFSFETESLMKLGVLRFG